MERFNAIARDTQGHEYGIEGWGMATIDGWIQDICLRYRDTAWNFQVVTEQGLLPVSNFTIGTRDIEELFDGC